MTTPSSSKYPGVVTVFTRTACIHCDATKKLLATKDKVKVEYVDLDQLGEVAEDVREWLRHMSDGCKTVPIIFVNYAFIPDGNANLQELEKTGELDSLLETGLNFITESGTLPYEKVQQIIERHAQSSTPVVYAATSADARNSDDDDDGDKTGDINGWIKYPSILGEAHYDRVLKKLALQKNALNIFRVYEKIDGCNFGVVVDADETKPLIFYSREKLIPEKEQFYGMRTQVAPFIEEALRQIRREFCAMGYPNNDGRVTQEKIIVFGELFGRWFPNAKGGFPSKSGSVQTRIAYSSRLHLRIFDVYFPATATRGGIWADQAAITKFVPEHLCVKSLFQGTFEDAVKWCQERPQYQTMYSDEGHDGVKQLAEGFVLTNISSWPKAKCRAPSFLEKTGAPEHRLLKKALKPIKPLTDNDMAWREYLTKNRFDNVVSHRATSAPLEPKDIPWIVAAMQKDIIEDIKANGDANVEEIVKAVDRKFIGAHVQRWVRGKSTDV